MTPYTLHAKPETLNPELQASGLRAAIAQGLRVEPQLLKGRGKTPPLETVK